MLHTLLNTPMTADEFSHALKEIGLTRAAFDRELQRIGGRGIDQTTLWRYAKGDPIPPAVAAYVRLRVIVHAMRDADILLDHFDQMFGELK